MKIVIVKGCRPGAFVIPVPDQLVLPKNKCIENKNSDPHAHARFAEQMFKYRYYRHLHFGEDMPEINPANYVSVEEHVNSSMMGKASDQTRYLTLDGTRAVQTFASHPRQVPYNNWAVQNMPDGSKDWKRLDHDSFTRGMLEERYVSTCA